MLTCSVGWVLLWRSYILFLFSIVAELYTLVLVFQFGEIIMVVGSLGFWMPINVCMFVLVLTSTRWLIFIFGFSKWLGSLQYLVCRLFHLIRSCIHTYTWNSLFTLVSVQVWMCLWNTWLV